MSLNRPSPAAMKGVAELLAMDRTTLTAAVKVLERRRLLKVAVDPDDRRGRLLTLTAAGQGKLAAAMPAWRLHHRQLEALLRDPGALRRDLGTLAGL